MCDLFKKWWYSKVWDRRLSARDELVERAAREVDQWDRQLTEMQDRLHRLALEDRVERRRQV